MNISMSKNTEVIDIT